MSVVKFVSIPENQTFRVRSVANPDTRYKPVVITILGNSLDRIDSSIKTLIGAVEQQSPQTPDSVTSVIFKGSTPNWRDSVRPIVNDADTGLSRTFQAPIIKDPAMTAEPTMYLECSIMSKPGELEAAGELIAGATPSTPDAPVSDAEDDTAADRVTEVSGYQQLSDHFPDPTGATGAPDQVPPVKGFRDITVDVATTVNINKEFEERLLRILDGYCEANLSTISQDEIPYDSRCIALARTAFQEGFMWMNRAVFKPGRVKLPDDPA